MSVSQHSDRGRMLVVVPSFGTAIGVDRIF